jgi:hypothetical protein
MPLVISGKELLVAAVSQDLAQQLLADRILKCLAENPEMLSEFRHRGPTIHGLLGTNEFIIRGSISAH